MKISRIAILILTLLLFLLVGCKDQVGSNEKDFSPHIHKNDKIKYFDEEDVNNLDYIEEKIKEMTLEEKIGQLLIVGFEGEDINENVISLIHDLKVGGFILFSRNMRDEEQIIKLLNEIKLENKNNKIPLFLSVDEEGGRVSRLPSSYEKLPDSKKVGLKNNKDISYEFGKLLGTRIKHLGFNLNFAPVLDIDSNPKNPVIGNRAFGATVDKVRDNAIYAMKGMIDMGIIPSVKHFPGHGDTDVDSHINLPEVNKSLEEIRTFELLPFIEAIENNVEMIMIAHILYPQIDKGLPATMSKNIIQGLLRDELGYEGVIVSDDMTMGAIVNNYSLEEGVLSFLKSGGDIALICHGEDNPKKIIDAIKEAVKYGLLSEEELDNKVYRILKLKDKFNLDDSETVKLILEDINKQTIIFKEKLNQ